MKYVIAWLVFMIVILVYGKSDSKPNPREMNGTKTKEKKTKKKIKESVGESLSENKEQGQEVLLNSESVKEFMEEPMKEDDVCKAEEERKKFFLSRISKDRKQFEKYDLEDIYFEEDIAEKLLEAFRLFGTKNKPYSTAVFWSLCGVTNKVRNYYMTLAYQKSDIGQPAGTFEIFEYAVCMDDELGVVKCQMHRDSEKVDGVWIHLANQLEILEIHGKLQIPQEELKTMILFHQEHNSVSFEQELSKKNGKNNIAQWNVERIHFLMLKKQKEWLEIEESLARDYEFVKTDDEVKKNLWKCIKSNVSPDDDYQNVKIDFALTDEKRTFYLTMCYYMSDFIKRCSEPDDYGYAVISKHSKGVAFIRFINGEVNVRFKRGDISLDDQRLCEAIWFYHQFYYNWQREYIKE